MKLLILDRADSWHVSDLIRAAGTKHQVSTATYEQLGVSLTAQGNSTFVAGDMPVDQFDVIITRAMSGGCSLEQVVFRMDCLAQIQDQLGLIVINPAKAIEASVDKYLSLEKIRAAGVNVPATSVCQTVEQAMLFFHDHGNDVVVKPIFGSQGRGVIRIRDPKAANDHFTNLIAEGRVVYLQEYIEHSDWDLRLLVIGEQVHAMRRHRPGHWVTNASLGSECTPHDATDDECEIAIITAKSQGAFLAGIDLIYDPSGKPFVVEANACPAWKRISEALQTDVASELISMSDQLLKRQSIQGVGDKIHPSKV